ncbi:hypothetical protein JCM8547_001457 [Rhodosporidiobolus lusitaniae]
MLDRLPVEFVRHILHLAAPLDYSPSSYRERRVLLCLCCLVSNSLKDVAQPMLPEVPATRLKSCKRNLLCARTSKRFGFSKSTFDLNWLSGLSKLRRLLIDDSIVAVDPSTRLESLTELSLFSYLEPPILRQVVSSSTTPSLLHLAVMDIDETSEEAADFFYSLPPNDLQRLHSLVLDSRLLPAADESYCEILPPAFGTVLSRIQVTVKPRTFVAVTVACQLDSLADAYRASVSSPRLIILPSQLRSHQVKSTSIAETVGKLVEVCEQRGVEIVWEDQGKWGSQTGISSYFRRKARKLTQERSEEQRRSRGTGVERRA